MSKLTSTGAAKILGVGPEAVRRLDHVLQPERLGVWRAYDERRVWELCALRESARRDRRAK